MTSKYICAPELSYGDGNSYMLYDFEDVFKVMSICVGNKKKTQKITKCFTDL